MYYLILIFIEVDVDIGVLLTPVLEAPLHLYLFVCLKGDILAIDHASEHHELAAGSRLGHCRVLSELHNHPVHIDRLHDYENSYMGLVMVSKIMRAGTMK